MGVRGLTVLCFVLVLCQFQANAHGDLHAQIDAVSKQIERSPDDAALYLKRGELFRADGDLEAALADYDLVERLDQEIASVELCRGFALSQAGRFQESKAALDRFLSRNLAHADAYAARARTLVALGNRKAAAEDFTRAINLLGTPNPAYFLERARALADASPENVDEALRGLDAGIEAMGPLVTLELLAVELEMKRQRPDRALSRLDEVARSAERKEPWLVRRAEVLEAAGRSDEAREAYAAALRAIETLPPYRRNTRATKTLEQQIRRALKQ